MLKDSQTFERILKNSKGFCWRIPKDSEEFWKSPKESKGFSRILKDSTGFSRIPKNAKDIRGALGPLLGTARVRGSAQAQIQAVYIQYNSRLYSIVKSNIIYYSRCCTRGHGGRLDQMHWPIGIPLATDGGLFVADLKSQADKIGKLCKDIVMSKPAESFQG